MADPRTRRPSGGPGTEGRTARSPLRLRLLLATIALVGFAALAIGLAAADASVAAVISALVALTALVDLVVVTRRVRRGDPG